MKACNLFSPAIACTVLVLATGELQADAWQKELSYGAELGFNDNFTLLPEPESSIAQNRIQEVSTLKATVGLSLLQLKPSYTAKLEAKLIATGYGGDVDGYRLTDSANGGALDLDEDGNVQFEGTELSSRLDSVISLGFEKRQERAVWRLDAGVLTDSLLQDISLDASDVTSGDTDNDDGLVRDDVTRTRFTITPSYLYRSSSISSYQGSFSAALSSFGNSSSASTALRDNTEFKLKGRYDREFSPVNSWSVDAEVQAFDADDAGDFSNFILGFGIDHKLSETTDIGLRVAQSVSDYDFQTFFTSEGGQSTEQFTSGDASRPLIQLTGTKKTGRTTYTVRLGSDLFGSASGEVVSVAEALFNVRYQYSELLTLTWRNKFFENKSLRDRLGEGDGDGNFVQTFNNSIDDTNRRFLALEPAVNWRFSRWWVMDAGLRYQREKRDSLGNSGESNYVFVGVTFSKPLEARPES